MLHTETVAQPTLELLKNLESEDALSGFNLAGGTALSLYLGHRVSKDFHLISVTFNHRKHKLIHQ